MKIFITAARALSGARPARYIAFGTATLLCGFILYAMLVILALQAYRRELDFVIR